MKKSKKEYNIRDDLVSKRKLNKKDDNRISYNVKWYLYNILENKEFSSLSWFIGTLSIVMIILSVFTMIIESEFTNNESK